MERDLHVGQRGADANHLVVARRGVKSRRQLRHGEADPGSFEVGVAHAARTDEVGAPDLAPDEIVRVVHDAHLIGLRVADAELDVLTGTDVGDNGGRVTRRNARHVAKDRRLVRVCKAKEPRLECASAPGSVLRDLRRASRLRLERRRARHARDSFSHVGEQGGSLLINGDLFEFWFEWKSVIPRRGFRTLAALADLHRRRHSGAHDRREPRLLGWRRPAG